ncbi:hypothetical protein SAMN02982918_1909 [Saccharomonospora viridis]|nr:hypothetical protein SAMN02982918_1909 [Saccharomonospora viridis]
MGHPQSWYPPQQYPPQAPYGQAPHPLPPRRSGTAMAYVSAALFLPPVIMAFVSAAVGWSGTGIDSETEVGLVLSLVGLAFSEDVTGNVDFAIATTMTTACTVTALGFCLMFRLNVIRWILAVIGLLVVGYYVYALIDLLSNSFGELIILPLVTFVLWLVPTVVAMLPPVGRAMRRFGRHTPPGGYGQLPVQGYGPGY